MTPDERLDRSLMKKGLTREEIDEKKRRTNEVIKRGNRRLLPSEPNSIREGDIVLLPNLPEHGRWLVAEVADDEYRYEIPPEFRDYGHVRTVRLLNPDSPVNPYDEAVSAHLRGTMRVRRRLWNIDRHEAEVRRLLVALNEGRSVERAQSGEERLEGVKDALKAHL
jgi:hypothetical protein